MGRCKNPGHRRWRIRKRDGVWQAFDPDGVLRYAAELHRMVLAFVLTQPKPKPSYVLLEPKDLGGATSWQEILRRALDHDPPPSDTKDTKAWENKRDVWDVLSNPGDPEDYPEEDERESE